jgi:hypothetical protein
LKIGPKKRWLLIKAKWVKKRKILALVMIYKGIYDLREDGHSSDSKELRKEIDGTRDDREREIGSKGRW